MKTKIKTKTKKTAAKAKGKPKPGKFAANTIQSRINNKTMEALQALTSTVQIGVNQLRAIVGLTDSLAARVAALENPPSADAARTLLDEHLARKGKMAVDQIVGSPDSTPRAEAEGQRQATPHFDSHSCKHGTPVSHPCTFCIGEL